MPSLDSATVIASLVWGSVGLGCAGYGLKQKSWNALFGGVALVAASYFISSAALLWLAGAVIAAAMWLLRGRF
ncbi:MAG: hypothetical protein U1F98_15380 [Verrucomicrobiota bacterium]